MTRLAGLAIGMSGLLLASSGAAADWMVFAVDGKGSVGHGVGSTWDAAREFALSYCGQTDCRIVDPLVDSGCMALTQSFKDRWGQRGYWFFIGTAQTRQKAQEFAMDFCSKNNRLMPQNCKVYYSYCLPRK
jgi:Domain of unknown function (DUF4189)